MLIDESLILLNADLKTKDDVIEFVSKLFDRDGRLNNLDEYIHAVQHREMEVSTNMGSKIAIPHGRTDAVKIASLAFVQLREPIKWGEEDEFVKIVFQIAVPESAGNLHLKILSKLARKLMYDDFKTKLFEVKDEKEVLNIIFEATGGL